MDADFGVQNGDYAMSYTQDRELLAIIAERILIQLSADDPYAVVLDW